MRNIDQELEIVLAYGELCAKAMKTNNDAELTAEEAAKAEKSILWLLQNGGILWSDLTVNKVDKFDRDKNMRTTKQVKCVGFTTMVDTIYLELKLSGPDGDLDCLLPV
jgi:hypothetical protein